MENGWYVHGNDGLGDSKLLTRENIKTCEETHASMRMVELVKENPNEMHFLCIGPLTNLALAIRLEPNLPNLINSITIMGGSEGAKGNTTRTAEFNFWADPESA